MFWRCLQFWLILSLPFSFSCLVYLIGKIVLHNQMNIIACTTLKTIFTVRAQLFSTEKIREIGTYCRRSRCPLPRPSYQDSKTTSVLKWVKRLSNDFRQKLYGVGCQKAGEVGAVKAPSFTCLQPGTCTWASGSSVKQNDLKLARQILVV